MAAESSDRQGHRLIYGGIAAFLLTCVIVLFLGGRLAPASHTEPGYAINEVARASADGTFEVTLDVSDRKHFRPFDLAAGRVRPQGPSDVPADLLIRRHVLRAPHGAINLGKVPLLGANLAAPPSWVRDKDVSGEPQNPALRTWYRYSYWTHALSVVGETYAVRLASGGVAYLNVVSYYCRPEGSGCMTIRYRLDLETPHGR